MANVAETRWFHVGNDSRVRTSRATVYAHGGWGSASGAAQAADGQETQMPTLVPGTAHRPALTVNIVFAPASPTGRLADAELLFHDGAFAGLTLTGFSVWDRPVRGYKVTVPRRPSPAGVAQQSARALRCLGPGHDLDGFQRIIIQAYVEQAAEREYRERCQRRSAQKTPNVTRGQMAGARGAEARRHLRAV